MATAKFIVTGRVQGVFYRASTRQRALELGLVGYARNQPDGSVEVVASGPDVALDALQSWLQQGPPAAQVARVTRAAQAEQALQGFRCI
ncbi:MAG TPA: acylphosphatase [Rhodanobacter sp.]|jgi:acylphosphatase|nr:acylphosphatase [Rhodanobacter sp.]